MNNADMPAMPMFDVEANPCRVRNPDTGEIARAAGLTKREMMAMHMMASLVASGYQTREQAVQKAIAATDALLSELERTCQKS